MPIQRVEWTCPSCGKRYAIPATAKKPARCPECRQRGATAGAAAAFPGAPVSTPAATLPPAAPQLGPAPAATPLPEFAFEEPEPAVDVLPDFSAFERAPAAAAAPVMRRKYPALRTIALCYRIVALLVAVGTVVGVVALMVRAQALTSYVGTGGAILIGIGGMLIGLIVTLSLFACAEVIQLQLDIEENTRPR